MNRCLWVLQQIRKILKAKIETVRHQLGTTPREETVEWAPSIKVSVGFALIIDISLKTGPESLVGTRLKSPFQEWGEIIGTGEKGGGT